MSGIAAESSTIGRRAGGRLSSAVGALAFLVLSTLGCHSASMFRSESSPSSLSGVVIEYRFDSGRRYRALYEAEHVSFELLEPVLANPPHRTLPYQSKRIRDGVFMVSWDDFEYAPVFLIDLPRREVHTRAQLENGDTLFLTAKIVMLRRQDEER